MRATPLLIALSVLAGCHRTREQQVPARTLAAARSALGWDVLTAIRDSVLVEGRAEHLGVTAELSLAFDAEGRFVQTMEGPLPLAQGFDGTRRWERDWNRTPRVLGGLDAAGAELTELFTTGRWSAEPEAIRFDRDVRASDGVGLELTFHHTESDLSGAVQLDPATFLPVSAWYGEGDARSAWTFGGWCVDRGFKFPGRIEILESGERRVLHTEVLQRRAELAQDHFVSDLTLPDDTRFDPGSPAALEVLRVATGHLLVRPVLDGRDQGWFIFDTGAGTNCIDSDTATGLGAPFGRIQVNGVGGRTPSWFRRVDELRLGPLRISGLAFVELDLGFLSEAFGVQVGGILGYELLARSVASIDLEEATISIFPPTQYTLPAGGTWSPVELASRRPCVRAEVEGQTGLFLLDTGAASDTVTFHTHAVARLGLLAGRETRPARAGGVGGSVATRVGMLRSFVLGGVCFEDVEAAFTTEEHGAFAIEDVWGNIGGRLLAPFEVVFDYPSGRVGFVPRRAPKSTR